MAIYNDNIVDLRFPVALYKKLLGHKCDLSDLNELSPTVGHSMEQLLAARVDDNVEDWELYFSKERTEFGASEEVDLIPNGRKIPVTFENKEKYVDAYIDYVFNVSTREKYEKFEKGFNMIVENPVYRMFRPKELQQTIAGAAVIDWTDIKNKAKYHDGFSAEHASVLVFWKALEQLSEDEKRQFLVFLTGTSRVPLSGLVMNIKKVNVSLDHLPVAHTCFNLLDLPPYECPDAAAKKLRTAIAQSSGFQLV